MSKPPTQNNTAEKNKAKVRIQQLLLNKRQWARASPSPKIK